MIESVLSKFSFSPKQQTSENDMNVKIEKHPKMTKNLFIYVYNTLQNKPKIKQ